MSKLQTIIIPRNWLFGRFAFIRANLTNALWTHPENLTENEKRDLREAEKLISGVISGKKKNSEILKQKYYETTKKNSSDTGSLKR